MEKHIWLAIIVERITPFVDGAVFLHISFRIIIAIFLGR